MPEANDNPIQEIERAAVPRLRGLLNVLVFALVFAGACFGISRLYDISPGLHREGGTPRAKIRWFAQHKDEYNLVFVGSSRIYRQMAPAIFDRRMRELGLRGKSFNFGIPAMRLPETLHTVDWILAQRPARLEWLVIELQDLHLDIKEDNLYTPRVISWHTPKILALAVDAARRSDITAWAKWREIEPHLLHTLYRLTNVGTAVQLFTMLLGYGGQDFTEDFLGKNLDGFRTLTMETAAGIRERRETFLQAPGLLQAQAARLEMPQETEALPEVVREVLERLVREVRAAGVEPVFIITPGNQPYPQIVSAHEEGVLPTLFQYNVPSRYPDFYEFRYHYDVGHLNSKGAGLFSETFAEEFAAWVKDKQD